MKINVGGKGLEVTDALRLYVESRLSGLERRTKNESDRIDVVLEREGKRFQAKIHISTGTVQRDVQSESDDMYVAIDQAKEKLYRVIEDRHDESIERKRRD